jgi:hypothetical protein
MDKNRTGDHICYISDLSKMRAHYPAWDITKGLEAIFQEIYEAWRGRSADNGKLNSRERAQRSQKKHQLK